MTIVEIPFLHRLYAATDKSPVPREMAAWDMERLRLDELPISELELGADLVDRKTYLWRGSHWATLLGAVCPPWVLRDFEGKNEMAAALAYLIHQIDPSRFFAEGRNKLPRTSILTKPPKVDHIRTSQRELNVANLSTWVQDNLMSVGGEVFVRVREPSVSLDVVGPFEFNRCYMTLKCPELIAASASEDHGILSTISGRHDLLALATGLLSSDERMIRVDSKFQDGVFEKMGSSDEDAADMAARTLVAQSKRLSRRNHADQKLADTLRREFKKPEREFGQDRLDLLADLLEEGIPEMNFPLSLMTRIVLDRWHDRPVVLGIDNRAQPPLSP